MCVCSSWWFNPFTFAWNGVRAPPETVPSSRQPSGTEWATIHTSSLILYPGLVHANNHSSLSLKKPLEDRLPSATASPLNPLSVAGWDTYHSQNVSGEHRTHTYGNLQLPRYTPCSLHGPAEAPLDRLKGRDRHATLPSQVELSSPHKVTLRNPLLHTSCFLSTLKFPGAGKMPTRELIFSTIYFSQDLLGNSPHNILQSIAICHLRS